MPITESRFFVSGESASPEKCLTDNCRQMIAFIEENAISQDKVLRLTLFVDDDAIDQSNDPYSWIKPLIAPFFPEGMPPLALVFQAPQNGSMVLEAHYIPSRFNNCQTQRLTSENTPYTRVESTDNIRVVYGSVMSGRDKSPEERIRECFDRMDKILSAEGMTMGNIVRQWNYLEDITGYTNSTDRRFQHYQILNEIRSEFYDRAQFDNGYPAATGIGMTSGGFCLEFTAVSAPKSCRIAPLSNPLQINAHHYSKDVLRGGTLKQSGSLSPPKFERGKALHGDHIKKVFISGTASISGELTSPSDRIDKQTELTIRNIMALTDAGNLKACGISDAEHLQIEFNQLRVYVKHKADVNRTKALVKKQFPNSDALYLIADICREALLVEIEASADLIERA